MSRNRRRVSPRRSRRPNWRRRAPRRLSKRRTRNPRRRSRPRRAGRGVFDTETLAAIYVNQGFYGRAAEIYRRLITQRPDDAGLRGKLEGVLALERGEAGSAEPVAAVAAVAAAARQFVTPATVAPGRRVPAAAKRRGQEQLISRLETLLETFKGGRPR